MTRVIAGTARGRRLQVPAGTATRPTGDRAREGLFNSLQSLLDLEGATVMDLFAGSGALGLEALSRGAESAVLVDSNVAAVAVLETNVATLGLPGARVVRSDVATFLAGSPTPVDLVLLDPPYELDVDPVLAALDPWVLEDGLVVVERATRGPAPTWPPGWQGLRERRYGIATLWYGSRS